MADTSLLLVGAILANNFVLPRAIGLRPYVGDYGRFDNPWAMGAVTASVLVPASAASHLIDRFLLVRYDLQYLCLVVAMVLVAAFGQFALLVLGARDPTLHRAPRSYLPLIVSNCVILDAVVAAPARHLDLFETVAYAFAASAGFTAIIAMFCALHARIDEGLAPVPFRGAPIGLITIGLTLLALMGFAGIQ